MKDLVSCIVPVYNGERFLAETIDSILAQTYKPIEIIVVDDGSTDNTRAVAQSFGERVQYIWQENARQGAACNTGIRAARGKYIAFCDSDDLWHPEKIAQQLAYMDAHPEFAVTVTLVQNFWMEEMRAEQERLGEHRHTKPAPGYICSAFLARRRAFEDVGLFDETWYHAGLQDWILRAALRGIQVGLVPQVLLSRRMHRGNKSRQYAERVRAEHLRVFKMYRDRQRAQQESI